MSIGINLNPNNACNWACVYCQVPGLTRGGRRPGALELLESELRTFLREVTEGDFMLREVPAEARRLVDVAFPVTASPPVPAVLTASIFGLKPCCGILR